MANMRIRHSFWTYHREFKITMNNMLRELIEKGDNMQRQMGNISREKEF